MRLLADEATIAQREADIRCQHKITEMMALMEKHKVSFLLWDIMINKNLSNPEFTS